MKNVYGNALTLTLFGESHGSSIGAVLDGLSPGIPVDEAHIARELTRRRPQGRRLFMLPCSRAFAHKSPGTLYPHTNAIGKSAKNAAEI